MTSISVDNTVQWLHSGYSILVQSSMCSCMQAVDEEAGPSAEEEFGGGVLRKRAKATKQDKQADAEAAALQQVCLAASCPGPVSN